MTPRRAVNVLVVDDHPGIRRLVSRVLIEEFGARVSEVPDGLSALEHLELNTVDVVLLDFTMPVINGLDVLQAMRRSPVHADVPVVIMTSAAGDEVVTELLRLGVTDYLLKPIRPAMLLERLAPVMSRVVLRPDSVEAPPKLDLRKSHRVLFVDQGGDTRPGWIESLRFLCRVDETASATEAMRRHQTRPYDAIVVGRTAGLLDGDGLAGKLRDPRNPSGPRVLALAPEAEADDRRRSGQYDAVLVRTSDEMNALGQLARYLTPQSAACLLLAPSSPYVHAMFMKVRDEIQDALHQTVTIQSDRPSVPSGDPRSVDESLDIRSGGLSWRVALACPYALGLAMACASRGLDRDRVSDAQIDDTLGGVLVNAVEPLRAGLALSNAECHVDDSVCHVCATSQTLPDVREESGLSHWLVVREMNAAALVRLISMPAKGRERA